MGKYLKLFQNHTEYEDAKASGIELPNISHCINEAEVHYNPREEETKVVVKVNVVSSPTPTKICNRTSSFTKVEIDGVVQPTVVSGYTFDTTGEHTVKYTLADSTKIGDSAFRDCYDITSVIIPNNVTSIGNYAFDVCLRLTSVNIPSGVTSIGNSAFASCIRLTSVTIPSGVTSIGSGVFNGCSGLTSVTIEATTPPTLGFNSFDNTNNCPTYVPSSSVETYKAASGWSTYASRIQAIQ
jgi:hypothetical protein